MKAKACFVVAKDISMDAATLWVLSELEGISIGKSLAVAIQQVFQHKVVTGAITPTKQTKEKHNMYISKR